MPDGKKERITLQSISESLGISKTTVSLVLKGDGDKYRISKNTQQKVLGYADSVGFVPDFLASALVTKKTKTIGIVFPDVHESFMSEMVKGIESVLYKAGYSVLISTSGFSTEVELRNIRQLLHRRVDGIIIVPYIPIAESNYQHAYLTNLKKSHCPFVLLDRIPEANEDLNWIIQDDRKAAIEAVRLLHRKGCRNIGCISFKLDASSINNRLSGFREGMDSCGLELQDDSIILIDKQDRTSGDLTDLVGSFANQQTPFDGLLVTTGGLAHKLRWIIKNTSIEIPEMKVVKFGKDPDYFDSGMIRIIQPNIEMGKLAAETILRLAGGESDSCTQIEVKSLITE